MTVKITKPALNLREELADLRKPSGIAGEALLRADSVQEQRDLIGAGRKNLLINGSFDVNQRDNLTLDAAATSFTDNAYYLDRWRANVGGSLSFTQEYLSTNQPAGINGASYRCNIGSSGSGFVAFHQTVENHLRYAGLSLTLSAWVKSNTTLARMLAYDGVAFKHGATHSGSGQWEKLSVTFTVQDSPTILDCYFGTYFNGSVAHNTGDYIEATQMQLELGSVATEFEHRSYGEELALCQRYYFKMNFPQTMTFGPAHRQTTNTLRASIESPVPMRSLPSVNSSGQPSWIVYWVNGTAGTGSNFTDTSGGAFSMVTGSLDGNKFAITATATGLDPYVTALLGYSGAFEFNAEL